VGYYYCGTLVANYEKHADGVFRNGEDGSVGKLVVMMRITATCPELKMIYCGVNARIMYFSSTVNSSFNSPLLEEL